MPTDPSSTADEPLTTETAPPETTPGHMLIVEDDEEVAALLETWARQFYGETVTVHVEHTVAGSEATLQSLPTLDVALLDRKLPDGTGGDILQVVTSQFDAITLMITGSSPESEIIRLPINDYIVKPVDEETLVKQLSLLEKLKAASALEQYSDARKASLLEYHLDDPAGNPLFRRFGARWSYDHLEIAQFDDQVVVYELYVVDATDGDGDAHVSITGSLAPGLADLLDAGEIEPVGELVPSREGYGWMQTESDELFDASTDSIGIYRFTSDTPEQYVTELATEKESATRVELAEILESEFG